MHPWHWKCVYVCRWRSKAYVLLTVVDYAINELREAIRSGKIEPGERLVVRNIAKMLCISSGPVREAIRRLTGEGLVEIVPHKGASVRKVSAADVGDIFELREAVEGLAARLAARRMTAEQKQQLVSTLAELDRHYLNKDTDGYLLSNLAFHRLIYESAQNERLQTMAQQLVLPIYQFRLPHRMRGSGRPASQLEHHAIAATLLTGDEDAAAAAMQNHIRSSGANLRATLEQIEALSPKRRRKRSTG